MTLETLSILVDLAFTIAGIVLVVAQLSRCRSVPVAESPPSGSLSEVFLTAAALVAAAVGPNILVIALTPGMPEMPQLARYALVPSLGLLAVVWLLGGWRDHPRLTNRIWVGVWSGAAATGVLDAIRLTGFHLGQMPGNMPRMFGVLILDRMALGPSLGSDVLGYLYHYWVGGCFGLVYTLLIGKFRWWGALVWGLIVELGMMVTPPMVVAMDTGYFGSKFGPGLLVTSFVAHVAFGSALGVLAERYTRHEGTIFGLLRDCFRHAGEGGPALRFSSKGHGR